MAIETAWLNLNSAVNLEDENMADNNSKFDTREFWHVLQIPLYIFV